MRETVEMVLAALLIGLMLYAMTIIGAYADGMQVPTAPPQERYEWPNPAGYGLQPETEEYNGIFY